MNKKEFLGAFMISICLVVLFCILVGVSSFIAISYCSVAIGEMPLGAVIGLIASVWGCIKLLNIFLSILKEIRST